MDERWPECQKSWPEGRFKKPHEEGTMTIGGRCTEQTASAKALRQEPFQCHWGSEKKAINAFTFWEGPPCVAPGWQSHWVSCLSVGITGEPLLALQKHVLWRKIEPPPPSITMPANVRVPARSRPHGDQPSHLVLKGGTLSITILQTENYGSEVTQTYPTLAKARHAALGVTLFFSLQNNGSHCHNVFNHINPHHPPFLSLPPLTQESPLMHSCLFGLGSRFYIGEKTGNICFSRSDLFHLRRWSPLPSIFL